MRKQVQRDFKTLAWPPPPAASESPEIISTNMYSVSDDYCFFFLQQWLIIRCGWQEVELWVIEPSPCSPLHLAAQSGLKQAVQELLSKGASVQEVDENGRSGRLRPHNTERSALQSLSCMWVSSCMNAAPGSTWLLSWCEFDCLWKGFHIFLELKVEFQSGIHFHHLIYIGKVLLV